MGAGHVGLDLGLVDEHQPARVDQPLDCFPAGAQASDVRPILLLRVEGLFLYVIPLARRNRHSASQLTSTPRSCLSTARIA